MGQTVRRRVIYHGRVQGVGFRATSRSIAQRFPVSGYVRNRADGTVELIVDGLIGDVTAFLAAVSNHFGMHITRTESEPVHGGEPMSGFSVRR